MPFSFSGASLHSPKWRQVGICKEYPAKHSRPICQASKINANRKQLSAEKADRCGIAGAARQLIREPALPLALPRLIGYRIFSCIAFSQYTSIRGDLPVGEVFGLPNGMKSNEPPLLSIHPASSVQEWSAPLRGRFAQHCF